MTGLRHAIHLARRHAATRRGEPPHHARPGRLPPDRGRRRGRCRWSPFRPGRFDAARGRRSRAPIDLVLSALYSEAARRSTTMGNSTRSPARSRADASDRPGGSRKRAPLVGVNPEYLRFRDLACIDGRPFAVAGECVVGYEVRVGRGSRSTTGSPLSLARCSISPGRIRFACGSWASSSRPAPPTTVRSSRRSRRADQPGPGHGRRSPRGDESELVMGRTEDDVVIGSAAVKEFVEITDENRASFHFHGRSRIVR